MRTGFLLAMLVTFSVGCSKEISEQREDKIACYSGKLVKKGPCGQMVVEITSENKAGLQYAAEWTDPISRIVYRNVFQVFNICDQSGTLNQGDSFTFSISNREPSWACLTCQAFTPVPEEKNNITVGCDTVQ